MMKVYATLVGRKKMFETNNFRKVMDKVLLSRTFLFFAYSLMFIGTAYVIGVTAPSEATAALTLIYGFILGRFTERGFKE